MNIRSAGNMAHAIRDLLRNPVVRVKVTANNLNVDGGGQAKVQDLTHDIRRLEEELRSRKIERQIFAQLLYVSCSRVMMLLIERDEYLGIGCADGSTRAVCRINRAERQPD